MHDDVKKDLALPTRKGALTEAQALDEDWDVLPALTELRHIEDFRTALHASRTQIEVLCAELLGLPSSDISLADPADWITGGFNLCLPIAIHGARSSLPRNAIIRFALPTNTGEPFHSRAVDEKVRCEAATYAWLQRTCPQIPTPRLLAVGFPNRQSLVAVENAIWWKRWLCKCRQLITWCSGGDVSMLAPFVPFQRTVFEDMGFLLLERVEEGHMLSSSWQQYRRDPHRLVNLYRGLARILLGLYQNPLPRSGSWSVDDNAVLSLSNRPLLDITAFWSRHSIPTHVPRNRTYSSTASFFHDLLSYQDHRMRCQLNAILNRNDGIFQISSLVGLRALQPRFLELQPPSRRDTFVLSLPDLHRSNIFVDDEWNITRLIDFEFAPVVPFQMVHVPSWLTGRGVDELDGDALPEFQKQYDTFVDIVEQEENKLRTSFPISQTLRQSWQTGTFWMVLALGSKNAFPALFDQHLRPRFFREWQEETDALVLAQLWDEDLDGFLEHKEKHLEEYRQRVHEVFEGG